MWGDGSSLRLRRALRPIHSLPEIRAGWFMWALRDATAQAGHYRIATEAKDFYRRMAGEIGAACDDGRLDCLPPRATVVPPFRTDYVWPTLSAAARMVSGVTEPEAAAPGSTYLTRS